MKGINVVSASGSCWLVEPRQMERMSVAWQSDGVVLYHLNVFCRENRGMKCEREEEKRRWKSGR